MTDQTMTTNPTTEAQVADALIQHETSGMCHYRRTCGTCDCGRSSLTVESVAEQDAMELGRARAVLALFASQPTVAQIKAEALREAAQEFWARLPDGTGNGRMYNSYRVAGMLRDRADRIESEG